MRVGYGLMAIALSIPFRMLLKASEKKELQALITFNSFQDATISAARVQRGTPRRLSIPFRMLRFIYCLTCGRVSRAFNSFQDATEAWVEIHLKVAMYSFNSFQDATLQELTQMTFSLRKLSIPFRMLHVPLGEADGAAVYRFQFLLGCYTRGFAIDTTKSRYLSIPFRMLH